MKGVYVICGVATVGGIEGLVFARSATGWHSPALRADVIACAPGAGIRIHTIRPRARRTVVIVNTDRTFAGSARSEDGSIVFKVGVDLRGGFVIEVLGDVFYAGFGVEIGGELGGGGVSVIFVNRDRRVGWVEGEVIEHPDAAVSKLRDAIVGVVAGVAEGVGLAGRHIFDHLGADGEALRGEILESTDVKGDWVGF